MHHPRVYANRKSYQQAAKEATTIPPAPPPELCSLPGRYRYRLHQLHRASPLHSLLLSLSHTLFVPNQQKHTHIERRPRTVALNRSTPPPISRTKPNVVNNNREREQQSRRGVIGGCRRIHAAFRGGSVASVAFVWWRRFVSTMFRLENPAETENAFERDTISLLFLAANPTRTGRHEGKTQGTTTHHRNVRMRNQT